MNNSRSKFWDNKILGWEKDRYILNNKKNLLNSVQERLKITETIIKKFISNKNVLEIGCGSGLLAEKIINSGAKSYTGYDFAASAILKAKERCKDKKNIFFYDKSIMDIEEKNDYDFVFSLGLIDWLNRSEINHLAKVSNEKDWLHSFSEKRLSFVQIVHKIYVILFYGYKNGMYIPRYDKKSDIKKFFYNDNIYFFSHKKLSFGVLATSFKVDNDEK